jgi:hypothetical protein
MGVVEVEGVGHAGNGTLGRIAAAAMVVEMLKFGEGANVRERESRRGGIGSLRLEREEKEKPIPSELGIGVTLFG